MDGLFQEMLGASNVDIDTNVDIVFAIDATESMQPLIDKVKKSDPFFQRRAGERAERE